VVLSSCSSESRDHGQLAVAQACNARTAPTGTRWVNARCYGRVCLGASLGLVALASLQAARGLALLHSSPSC